MKKKFGLWLNIVTICLCICAIAIGVYAATSASLTVSGKIGFTAHGVDLAVTGTIEGHAVKDGSDDINGTPSTAVPLPNATFEKGVGSMDMGSRFFTDLTDDGTPADIIIRLSVTNNSPYAITGTAGTHTLPSNVTATVEPASVEIAKGATQPFVITLSMTATNDNYDNITSTPNNTQINMTFEKYEKKLVTVKNGKAYIEMGVDPDTKKAITWYAIAKNGETLKNTTFTNEKEITPGTYIFISEYLLENSTGGNTMAFNSSSNMSAENNYGVNYNGSEIQQYVNGTGVGTLDGRYNFSSSELWDMIEPYDCKKEYVVRYREVENDGWLEGVEDEVEIPATLGQNLWLLSKEEYTTWIGEEYSLVYFLNDQTVANSWWLRSGYRINLSDEEYLVYAVAHGWSYDLDCNSTDCAVRVACQIIIE